MKKITRYLMLQFLLSGATFASQANAVTCTANSNVTADCDDLVLNGASTVTVDAGVTVSGTPGVTAAINAGASNSLVNAGIIIGNGSDGFHNNASLATLSNTGIIRSFREGGRSGVVNTSIISNLYNSGSISGLNSGLSNAGTITSLINASGGSIGAGGPGLSNGGNIETLTNVGRIVSVFANDLSNSGAIGALNNLNAGQILRYSGVLPENYNIIIVSPASFGKLAVTSASGTTVFGISSQSSGASAVSTTPYAAVLSGVTRTQLGISGSSLTSQSNGYSYTLSETDSVNNIWSLLVSNFYLSPSIANTNQSLVNTVSALQGTYTLQNSTLANSFTYDCTEFGVNNVCVSAGGRNTQAQASNGLNNTSTLLIAAYRPHPNYRIGAYADQNLSASNPGGTVSLGNNTPLIGLFGAWKQRLDGTGTEIKVSAAFGQKNATITRSVVGSGDSASEAGSGSSKLNSQGVQVTAKYGFAITDKFVASPYIGMRYSQSSMGGYAEASASTVTAPLTYSALNTNATTALVGVGASYKLIPAVTTFASAGMETDTNASNGTYTASNVSIGALAPVNLNPSPIKTRPTATLGFYYDVAKNQRLGAAGIYRQEAYQAVSTTTVLLTYTIGL